MNIFVWVLQGLMGMLFLRHGSEMIKFPDHFKERMTWVTELAPGQRKTIGAIEMLGGLGLLLPGIFGMFTNLTPIAAGGLALTMVGAIAFHIQRKDELRGMIFNLVLLLITGFIAYYRWMVLPL